LYERIREYILSLDSNLIINCRNPYIGFDINNKNLYGITLLKKSLKLWINARIGELDDPKNIARDVSKIGHWGNGDYEIQISNDEDIEYIYSLIKQLYKRKSL
jgi:predicted transport protein